MMYVVKRTITQIAIIGRMFFDSVVSANMSICWRRVPCSFAENVFATSATVSTISVAFSIFFGNSFFNRFFTIYFFVKMFTNPAGKPGGYASHKCNNC